MKNKSYQRRLSLIKETEERIADLEVQIKKLTKDRYIDDFFDEYMILLSKQLAERKKLREIF